MALACLAEKRPGLVVLDISKEVINAMYDDNRGWK